MMYEVSQLPHNAETAFQNDWWTEMQAQDKTFPTGLNGPCNDLDLLVYLPIERYVSAKSYAKSYGGLQSIPGFLALWCTFAMMEPLRTSTQALKAASYWL